MELNFVILSSKGPLNSRLVYSDFQFSTWVFNIMFKRELFSQIFLFKITTFIFMLNIWENILFPLCNASVL